MHSTKRKLLDVFPILSILFVVHSQWLFVQGSLAIVTGNEQQTWRTGNQEWDN